MSNEVEAEILQQGVHNYSAAETYIAPEDPAVQKKLEWFQNQKLGLMIHWGLYCQLGMVASWALSDEDASWSRHQVNWTQDGEAFKKQYYGLNRSFNPIRFQPEEWAQMAEDCGFKYLLFTTKHHDGFCLWDSQYTDYKTTGEDCPYHTSEHADIVKSMFQAFQEKGLGIGAYFSKADWHTPYYRTPLIEDNKPSTRGPMYDPAEDPQRWEQFVQFTKNQVLELCRNYGPVDILWFDAGWVCPQNGQDIRLGELVEEARKLQPGVLSVDRTVGGKYENYVTPEMCVPESPLGIPWESCLTLGVDFTYEFADRYKTPRELVNTLVGIVAKGGNLVLNVSPQPDGRIPVDAMDSLRGLGAWLKQNGEAIYGTRPCAPYQADTLCYTQKGDITYVFRLYPIAQESVEAALFIPWEHSVKKVTLLEDNKEIPFTPSENAGTKGITVEIPAGRRGGSAPIALVFRLEK